MPRTPRQPGYYWVVEDKDDPPTVAFFEDEKFLVMGEFILFERSDDELYWIADEPLSPPINTR